MRRFMIFLLAALLLLGPGTVYMKAEETEETFHVAEREPGFCGENIRWHFEEGKLILDGSGPMDDFPDGTPWQVHRKEIKELELLGEITYIGAYAFKDFDSLEVLKLGESLTEIGRAAFEGCDGLTAVELPGSFRIFGEESFSHCKNLTEFYFNGGMPKFKLNCLWDTYAKLIYPAQRPWPLQHIEQLEEAFKGRIEFLSSDGTDPYVPEAETEAETEPPASETETEETAAPTEATTVPTEAPAEKPTEAPTEAPTKKPVRAPETVPPAEEEYVDLPDPEAPAEEEETGLSLPLAGLIALMVISGGGALFLMGRMSGSRKKSFEGDFSEILLEDERKAPKKKKKATVAQKTAAKSRNKKGGKYRK